MCRIQDPVPGHTKGWIGEYDYQVHILVIKGRKVKVVYDPKVDSLVTALYVYKK